tara:strand:- start:4823 stop:5437 length:615 start_codon:yes stop_codon:yes gene_type:complete
MKASEMLKKINTLLGVNVELEELVLDNGTRIFADSYDKGESVFIVTDEDERVPLPAGEYMISDGRMLIVKDDGMIDEVRLETVPEAEEEGYKDGIADEKEDEREEMEEEIIVDVPDEIAPEMGDIIAAVVEVVSPIIEEVKKEIEELKRKYGEVDKVKEKMSKQPARKPLAHAPTKKNDTFLYGQNRPETTIDRVLAKISQIKK